MRLKDTFIILLVTLYYMAVFTDAATFPANYFAHPDIYSDHITLMNKTTIATAVGPTTFSQTFSISFAQKPKFGYAITHFYGIKYDNNRK